LGRVTLTGFTVNGPNNTSRTALTIANLTVNGNMVVNAGISSGTDPSNPSARNSIVTLSTPIINGDLIWNNPGGAAQLVFTNFTINGNLTQNMFSSNVGNSISASVNPIPITGNFTVNCLGTYTTDLNISGIGIEANISGNAVFNLGNNNTTISFDPRNSSSQVLGSIVMRVGDGNNNLTFFTTTSNVRTYTLDAIYGNGNNTVTLNDANATLKGSLIGGSGTNHFVNTAGTLGSPWTTNFT
jgi:hypothetical protein